MSLPKGRKALTEAVDNYVHEAESRYLTKFIQMALSYLFTQGHRDMSITDLASGEILFNKTDWESGRVRNLDQRVQSRYNQAVEQLMRLDFSPVVTSEEIGLSSVRERASAQILIDSLSDVGTTDAVKQSASETAVMYGSAGIIPDVALDPNGSPKASYDVVCPWNIFPYPLSGMNLGTDMSGICLRRFKRVSWMKEKFGDRVSRHMKDMDVWRTNHGVNHSTLASIEFNSRMRVGSLGNPGGNRTRGKEEMGDDFCELREFWFYRPGCAPMIERYVAVCGDWVIEDKKITDVAYCPLSFARYRNDGTFHGIGLPAVLMPLAVEAETLMSRLFEYATDVDRFGFLWFPDTMVDMRQMEMTDRGLAVGRYDADLNGNAKPFYVQPPSPTDIPGRTLAMTSGLMDEIVPNPSILAGDAPGRVEGYNSIALLNEAAVAAVATGSDNLARMKGEADRYLVHRVAKDVAEGTVGPIPIKNLDINLIGAVVSGGREDGAPLSIKLDRNPLPDVSKLRFSIKESKPRLKEARKQEVVLAVTQQRLSPHEFQIINYRENLGIPMASEVIAHTIRSTTLNALLLFNDGEQPGQAILQHDMAGDHATTLYVLDTLMSMPEFLLASGAVHDAFVRWKEDELNLLGQRLPGATPPVDEAATILQRGEQLLGALESRMQG